MAFRDHIVLDDLEQRLFDAMSTMPVIDAHEHIRLEKEFVETPCDWAWLAQYVINDLHAAGLDPAFQIYDATLSGAEKWARMKPYWQAARWGSPARIMRCALGEWFGVDDVADDNVAMLTERVNANRREGFYDEALAKKCRVERVITNARHWNECRKDGLVRAIVNIPLGRNPVELRAWEERAGVNIRTSGDLVDSVRKWLADALAAGAVGFKTVAFRAEPCDRHTADRLVAEIAAGRRIPQEYMKLVGFIRETACEFLKDKGALIAVHCGCYGDYREAEAVNVYETMMKYPGIRFDLFHMSVPATREAVLVGKYCPNATHNLCGALLFSQRMFENSLDEWLDIMPTNRVIAFGGDYQWRPELVWGHLQFQQESYARVFASRIRRGAIDFDSSVEILRSWFYDNPKRMYRL